MNCTHYLKSLSSHSDLNSPRLFITNISWDVHLSRPATNSMALNSMVNSQPLVYLNISLFYKVDHSILPSNSF
jgi:hypothetical protein